MNSQIESVFKQRISPNQVKILNIFIVFTNKEELAQDDLTDSLYPKQLTSWPTQPTSMSALLHKIIVRRILISVNL